jgi:hypothetical protein
VDVKHLEEHARINEHMDGNTIEEEEDDEENENSQE